MSRIVNFLIRSFGSLGVETEQQGARSGCYNLAATVFLVGLCDYVRRDSAKLRIVKEAESWVWSNDREYPYSFVRLCEYLGFKADFIRNKLEDPRIIERLLLESAKSIRFNDGSQYRKSKDGN